MTSSIKRQVQRNSHERAHHAWADGKSFEITDVVANSPATGAGLKVGNRILTIDGQKSDQLDLLDARTRLKTPVRRRVPLLGQAGTEQRAVMLTLRDLL